MIRLRAFLLASPLATVPALADVAPVTPTSCGPGGSTCDGSGPASQGNTSDTDQGAGNPINVITGNKTSRKPTSPHHPASSAAAGA